MWNTCRKVIALRDQSCTFMAVGIVALMRELNPYNPKAAPLRTGLKPFDALGREQKIAAVHEIAAALLCAETAAPKPACYRSATLLAVFRILQRELRREILTQNTVVRSLALSAHSELVGEIHHGIAPECPDTEQWGFLLECIENQMLDDRFFEISDEILDLPSQEVAGLFAEHQMNKDYFVSVPEDPTSPQAVLLAGRTLSLCKDKILESMHKLSGNELFQPLEC